MKCRTEAKEELRRQVGTLRFDLNTLASAKGDKAAKKAALAARKDFIKAVRGCWNLPLTPNNTIVMTCLRGAPPIRTSRGVTAHV